VAKSPTSRGLRTQAVLLDAFGTLITLDRPVPRLRAGFADLGRSYGDEQVARAFAAEVSHYRAHHLRGHDRRGVRALRLECGRVMGAALGPDAPAPAQIASLLVSALRFRLHPQAPSVLAGLADRGLLLGLVSNWDASLRDLLADLGIGGRFGVICISAECGVAKPDPAIFTGALRRLGVSPARALHCGDDPVLDGEGAADAGIRSLVIGPERAGCDPRIRWISGLADLLDEDLIAPG
jgi:FMN phosphatase YigB (HAD superfamily)